MPNMSGESALEKLKENPKFNIPVIALTADAISGAKEKYVSEGFVDYIAKPFSRDQIREKLNDIFRKDIKNGSQANEDIWKNAPTYVLGNQNMISTDIKTEEPKEEIKEKIEEIETTSNKNNVEYLKSNGIDVNHGLELLGDMDMYNETIKMFYEGIEERIKKLEEYKNKIDMNSYAVEVHALKSDCKYLGIMDLADISYQHELSSKAKDIAYINNNFNQLKEKVIEKAKIIKEYI